MAPRVLADVLGLESMDQAAPPTFERLLRLLWESRYQGEVTLSFAGGLPRAVVLSQPVQVTLDTGKRSGA